MLNIRFSGQFKKDYKRVKKQGFSKADEEEFTEIISNLANQKPLAEKYRDHSLLGKDYVGTREFHFRPDLLVVYRINNNELELLLLRMGSHSELF